MISRNKVFVSLIAVMAVFAVCLVGFHTETDGVETVLVGGGDETSYEPTRTVGDESGGGILDSIVNFFKGIIDAIVNFFKGIANWFSGLFGGGGDDHDNPSIPDGPVAVEYTGASIQNYNPNNIKGSSNFSTVFKGESGTTMVFQVAEIQDYVYAVYGYTAGDGYEHDLASSNAESIQSSITKSISNATSNTTSIETSHTDTFEQSVNIGFELSQIFSAITPSVEFGFKWGSSDTTSYLNSKTTSSEYARSVGQSHSIESGFSKTVEIQTESGWYYCWAETRTAYCFETVTLVWDYDLEKYVVDDIEFVIAFDDQSFDRVYKSRSKVFDFGYNNSETCILSDVQIDAAVADFNSRHGPGVDVTKHTVRFFMPDSSTPILERSVSHSGIVAPPNDPTLYGKIFVGWSLDGNIINLSEYKVKKDIDLVAVFDNDNWADYTKVGSYSDLIKVSSKLSGKYVLTADIDLGGQQWTPIGMNSSDNESNQFSGVFDGNGYTIKNFKITKGYESGLFGVSTGTICNLKIENVTMSWSGGYDDKEIVWGSVVARNWGTVENCSVTNSNITLSSTATYKNIRILVGGIAGTNTPGAEITGCSVESCKFTLSADSTDRGNEGPTIVAGGVCGYTRGIITNCYAGGVQMDVKESSHWTGADIIAGIYTPKQDVAVGGIVGRMSNTGGNTVIVEDCYSDVSTSSLKVTNDPSTYGNMWGVYGPSWDNIHTYKGSVVGLKDDSVGTSTIMVIDSYCNSGAAVGAGSSTGITIMNGSKDISAYSGLSSSIWTTNGGTTTPRLIAVV